MTFTSLEFLIFISLLLPLYFFVPGKLRWALLLAASYFFYAYLELTYLIFLIVPTIILYATALKLEPAAPGARKKLLLFAGITVSLTLLLIFKYTDFIRGSFLALAGIFTGSAAAGYQPLDLVLPIGISFYSFKMTSYIIDVYNGKLKAERHLGYFALYVSFFPQLLAGPIDRAVHFIPQLKKKVQFDYDRVTSGLRLTAWGFFKKLVIADSLAPLVNRVFDNVHDYSGAPLAAAVIAYSFQIYCDFSGYSDIAIGLSRMFGFHSMKNFNSPYSSQSVVKFWNNWHISLSTWLRDYLFLPICYAVMRKIKTPRLANIKAETWGYTGGMFITMFLGGLWHGAGWTFVLWGTVHGIFLILSYTTKKLRKKIVKKTRLKQWPCLHKTLKISTTFSLVTFAWIFFRANSIPDALYIISHLFTGLGTFLGDVLRALLFDLSIQPVKDLIVQLGITAFDFSKIITAVAIMEIIQARQRKTDINSWFCRKSLLFRWSCYYLLLLMIIYWGKYDIKEFIYFRF